MTLIEEIQELSLQDKEVLFNRLGVMISQEKSNNVTFLKDKAERLKVSLCAALGVAKYSVKSRERKNVVVRVLLTNLLLRMGHTEHSVARALGKDHSTIHHYKDMLNSWMQFPMFYTEEIAIWNNYKQAYETDTRTI